MLVAKKIDRSQTCRTADIGGNNFAHGHARDEGDASPTDGLGTSTGAAGCGGETTARQVSRQQKFFLLNVKNFRDGGK